MTTMTSVCVFCGSSVGNDPLYRTVSEQLGQELARRGLTLVYGGGNVGLMGAIADATLAAGGTVRGYIPRALREKEVAHLGLTELRVLGSMHERKAAMEANADGFIALPGGFGTLDELCEILTWGQLGIHRKPIGILDVDGYYAPLLAFFDGAVERGFIRPDHRSLLLADTDPAILLDRMIAWQPTIMPKWTTAPSPAP
ncbi:MAG: TIGR00730 family Rossman fold protein [Thermomicrobiales bacterium]